MHIRELDDADLEAMTAIYNDAVVNTTAIWNDTVVSIDNRRAWVAARKSLGYPVLVAEIDGAVAGYATFADFRAFDGYRFTVEHSIYVDKAFRRRGIARALLPALIERARAIGKHVMLGAIAADNAASIRLHADAGFVEVGRLPQVGRKFDRWLDLVFMQLTLDAAQR
jgi:phosphinothricin acetyltransferase